MSTAVEADGSMPWTLSLPGVKYERVGNLPVPADLGAHSRAVLFPMSCPRVVLQFISFCAGEM